MRYLALATDYDGTLASDGVVDESTVAALGRARAAALRLILVTGRQLPDLLTVFPDVDLFDRVVAENGAILYAPTTRRSRALASAPPRLLLNALEARGVSVSVGQAIVATTESHKDVVVSIIRNLGLPWHVVLNRDSVMALPARVTKATGLAAALEELGISADDTVAVGDAENDQPFMDLCRAAVAVANALPALKDGADFVTPGPGGAGVRELIDLILAGGLIG
jgi:hydroxymethylpyrimidine pyrophosphatase-like HAD family hydrolase